MASDIKVKSGMAFNMIDPFQEKMYNHICSMPNVSGYLKRLVAFDMMSKGNFTINNVVQEETPEVVEFNPNMMNGMI